MLGSRLSVAGIPIIGDFPYGRREAMIFATQRLEGM
jgi:hypothetical protein